MKLIKKALLILTLLLAGTSVYSQPQPPTGPNAPIFDNNRLHRNPQQAPVAPATLLLLGLGATAVGVKLHRNTKK